jgi:signal transduction histidine kinase/GAF domain-containing protein
MARLLNKRILEDLIYSIDSCNSLESLLNLFAKETSTLLDSNTIHIFLNLANPLGYYYTYKDRQLINISSSYELPVDPFINLILEDKSDSLYINKNHILNFNITNSSLFNSIKEEHIFCFKLFSRGQNIGILAFSSNSDLSNIPEDKFILLRDIIKLFGVYADNILLAEKLSQQNESGRINSAIKKENSELTILNDIIKKSISTLRISELLDYLVTYLTRQTNFDRVLILIQNKEFSSDFEGLIATIENKQKFSINNLYLDSALPTTEKLTNILKKHSSTSMIIDEETFVAIPLIVRGKLAGILAVDNYFKQKCITLDELNLLHSIASQIDISIDNARLYEDMKHSALGFKQLFEVASSFNTILDYEQASKVIVEKIASSIAVSQGYLISFEIDNYSQVIASVNDKPGILNTEVELSEPLKQSIVTKRPVIYNYLLQPKTKCLDLKYALVVPLYIKNKLTGLLCLGEDSIDEKRVFTEHDIKLVQTIANQAAITLENAQLYNKLEDMVVERTVELIDSNKALQKQKEKLEILSQRLQAIISSIPDGILVINKDNQILSSNPAFMKILNFVNSDIQIDSLIGLSLMKIINFISVKDDVNRSNFGGLLETIVEKDNLEPIEIDLVLENGTSHYYKVLTAPVKISTEANQANKLSKQKNDFRSGNQEKMNQVIVFHDVTREKEIDKLKSDFIAVVSHELKTPVSAMMGFATLIEDGIAGDITEEQMEYLNKIQIQGERLIRLINDLLDFSKLEAGQMPLYLQLLDPDELVIEVVETLRPLADEKSMKIKYNIEKELPSIFVDPDKLKQILINLISNAIKFTPENTGVIDVNVSYLEKSREIILSVKDNGIGIPEKDKERLFERFYQVDNSSTRKYGGTGLGLAIVKKLVELNKGNVWVESQIGKGSTFYFTVAVPEEE